MAARSKKATRGQPEAVDADAVVATDAAWLGRQPLAGRSRDAYLAQVRFFVSWLAPSTAARPSPSQNVRDWAVRDYKRHVKTSKHWAPTSVNQALAAIDNFYRSLGVGRPEVAREDLAQVAPRALGETSSDGSCGRSRVAVGSGSGHCHSVLLYRAAPLRARRPRGGRPVDLGSAWSAAGAFRQGRRLPGGAPQQRLPHRYRRVDQCPGWPAGDPGRGRRRPGGDRSLVAVEGRERHERSGGRPDHPPSGQRRQPGAVGPHAAPYRSDQPDPVGG